MKISSEKLEREAVQNGFRPEILEKVIHLIHLLNQFVAEPFLSSRIALKGGTALNLFYFDSPRLSVDIDINYIGSIDREVMLQERQTMMMRMEEICLDKITSYKKNRMNSRWEMDISLSKRLAGKSAP